MSSIKDEYKTIAEASEGLFKDRGSKFLAFAYPVECEPELDTIRTDLKKQYHDARHHVYAFRLGADMNTFRASDDGEPSNSSGPPVLGVIRAHELTDILIVVVRYFGGTKLGISGLINAYKSAAEDALANARIIEKTVTKAISLTFEYPQMNDVMRIVKEENLTVKQQRFELNCEMELSVRLSEYERIKERFEKFYEISVNLNLKK